MPFHRALQPLKKLIPQLAVSQRAGLRAGQRSSLLASQNTAPSASRYLERHFSSSRHPSTRSTPFHSGTLPMPDDVRDALRKSDALLCEFFRQSKYSLAYQMANGTAPEHLTSRVKDGKLRVYQGSWKGVVSLVQSSALYAHNPSLRSYPNPDHIRHLTHEVIDKFCTDSGVDDHELAEYFKWHQNYYRPNSLLASTTYNADTAVFMAGKGSHDAGMGNAYKDGMGIINEVLIPVERVLVPPSCVAREDEVFAVLFSDIDTNYTNQDFKRNEGINDLLIPGIPGGLSTPYKDYVPKHLRGKKRPQ